MSSQIKNVLITGSKGYIGPVLIHHIKNHMPNIHITGIDTGYFNETFSDIEQFNQHSPDHYLELDFRTLTEADLIDYDAIIHLAAISNDPMGESYKAVTEDINLKQSIKFAENAKNANVKKFVFASSCSVYGLVEGEDTVSEQSSIAPVTTYAKTKVDFESALKTLSTPSFQCICLRFATACGPSSNLRLDLVLNDFVHSALFKGEINILSDGKPWRPLIDTRDMASALAWAAFNFSFDTPFIALNTGQNKNNFQIKDLANIVAKQLDGVKVNLDEKNQPDKRSYKVDFSQFEALVEDQIPLHSLEDTVSTLTKLMIQLKQDGRLGTFEQRKRLFTLNQLKLSGSLNEQLYWNSQI
ncbi:SDR family oxidoreductase [Aestuariibacter sp. AA17]|uniref:SDR family oxidoreductase n=1 Tax=Fluctibacter corallii TaxID=2984329 RepID=A0ABT3A9S9_9ALTE|nr:SDR family oxidoreductase [Aestuariibacter sp. AA17]MCV2885430.1 SDR family oxidoreductase [Aestuariibacter sp. AA17]